MTNRKYLLVTITVILASFMLASCSVPKKTELTTEPTTTEQRTTEQTTTTAATSEDTTQESTEDSTRPANPNALADFTVYDREGNPKKLSDLRGKPVVLNFWATWCHYCVEEMPLFEEAYKKYGDSVEFMLVDLTDGYQEKQEWGEEFIDNKNITAPVFFDLDQDAAVTHSIYSIPVTYLIYSDGSVYDCTIGQIGKTYLDDHIPNLD